MAIKCEICGKTISKGNIVSHAHNKTKRVWKPNLQNIKAKIGGSTKYVRVCARCIKSNKIQKAVS
ncbi:MAG TPA: 50S ribosomal protein L28 [bacterium]|nr:50S ribosomal protein L28 [bacterium]HPN31458.1 50S ribosomal protein L28 [bacterium]